MLPLIHPCYRQRGIFLVSSLFVLLCLLLLRLNRNTRATLPVDSLKGFIQFGGHGQSHLSDSPLYCPHLPGLEDVLVILKTGITESREKVPVHIKTALHCAPNYVVFSDFEETISGVKTHDVLRNVRDEIKHTNEDFEIYNRVRKLGREGLADSDFPEAMNGPFGRTNNPGWRLDKWKFLPMIDEALQMHPTAKWYVFMEGDTYLVWPNLMAWLAKLDPERPLYLGSPVQIGDVIFGHGGSGLIISNPAMRMASEYYAAHRIDLDDFTAEHWAGDCVLGKVLAGAGVPLIWSSPMLQGALPWNLDYFGESLQRKFWCYPAVSYHHATPENVERLWQFEQEWFPNENRLLLHSDVLRDIVLPDIMVTRDNWDNLSTLEDDEMEKLPIVASMGECERLCSANLECLQFSYENSKCGMARIIKKGVSRPGIQSSWMTGRILYKIDQRGPCTEPSWVLE